MANLAAIIPAAKAPLEVQEVPLYTPGPDEFLVKNEIITFTPFQWKLAKLALFPIPYPSILGSSLGGTITSVGSQVTDFKVGDKVAVARNLKASGNQYGAYQRYVVVKPENASKLPEGVDVTTAAGLIGNLSTVVALFNGRVGLDKPSLDAAPSPANKSKKVLVYGGSSSFGSLAVQYVSQAGYAVVTTSSPKHKAFVEKLGPVKVIDHTQEADALGKALAAEGPYDLVVDSISTPQTISITGSVVAAQGGGKVWPGVLDEEGKEGLLEWAYNTYFPQGLAKGKIIPQPVEKVEGGLKAVNDALDKLQKGVSGVKVVLDPWE